MALNKEASMSTKNKEIIQHVFDGFRQGNADFLATHLADHVQWNVIGVPLVQGKSEVIKVMKKGLESEALVSVERLVAEGDEVRVESINRPKVGEAYKTFYCEIYRLKDEKIEEITCYRVATKIPLTSLDK
jgi:ketosteroid isomerase-like protein